MRSIRSLQTIKNLALLCAFSVLTLAVLEGAARVRAYRRYGTWSYLADDFFVIDQATGLRVARRDKDLGGPVANSLGYRGPEPQMPKPANRIRLAFIGASTTFCHEVGVEENTWPYLVWSKLKDQNPDLEFDYVNAAVPGYRLRHSLEGLKAKLVPLRPDVIVVYHAVNDLADITRGLAKQHGITTYSLDTPSWLAKRSLLYYLLEKNYRLWSLKGRAFTGDPRFNVPAPEYSPKFETDLRELVSAGLRAAPVVVLATFSTRLRDEQSAAEQLAASESSRIYMPFLGIPQLMEGYAEFNAVIRRVANSMQIVLVDDEMSIQGNAEHFVDTVHFTPKGSRAMAKRVTAQLQGSGQFQQLLAQKRPKAEGQP